MINNILKKIISFAVQSGQLAHASPLVICAVGIFISTPSVPSFIFIVVSIITSTLTVGMVIQLHVFLQGMRVYHDILVRYKGCKLTAYDIKDFINVFSWESANRSEVLYNKNKNREDSFKVNLFFVSRNKKKSGKNMPQLCSYVSHKPLSPYIFIPSVPNKIFEKPQQKFKLLHELGHVSLSSEYLVTPLYLTFFSFWYFPIFVFINIDLSYKENIYYFSFFIVIIIIIILGVTRQIIKERWLIDEAEADQYALKSLTNDECNTLWNRVVKKGFLDEPGKNNDRRKELFYKSMINPSRRNLQTTVMFSLPMVTWYLLANIALFVLLGIGFLANEMSYNLLVINSLLMILIPLIVIISFTFLAAKIKKSLDIAINEMKIDGEFTNVKWLDRLHKIYKITVPRKTL